MTRRYHLNHNRLRKRFLTGFTLMELLVVIAIIGLLDRGRFFYIPANKEAGMNVATFQTQ